VIYFLATGRPPTAATTRIVRDTLPSLSDVVPNVDYSPGFAHAVKRSLAVRAIDRYKSIGEFREALGWSIVAKGLRVNAIAENTVTLAALTAEDIRRITAPEHEAALQAAPIASPASHSRRAPAIEKLRAQHAGYEPGGQTMWLIAAMLVVVLATCGVVYFLRR